MFRSLTALAIATLAGVAPAVTAAADEPTTRSNDAGRATIVAADPEPVSYSPVGLYVAQIAILDCLDQLDPEAPCRWE